MVKNMLFPMLGQTFKCILAGSLYTYLLRGIEVHAVETCGGASMTASALTANAGDLATLKLNPFTFHIDDNWTIVGSRLQRMLDRNPATRGIKIALTPRLAKRPLKHSVDRTFKVPGVIGRVEHLPTASPLGAGDLRLPMIEYLSWLERAETVKIRVYQSLVVIDSE